MKKGKLFAFTAAAAMTVCLMPQSVSAEGQTSADVSVIGQNKTAADNYCNKQDNKEAPYDSSYWIQPTKWMSDPISPDDYEGNVRLWFDKFTLSASEAKSLISGNKTVPVKFHVKGAAKKASVLAFHVIYDTRLTPVNQGSSKNSKMKAGYAIEGKFSSLETQIDNGCISWVSSAADDILYDGVIFSMEFRLPDNAKAGDLYPIGIRYDYDGITSDLFYNSRQDYEGKQMMTYVFNKGIENGYIKIEGGGLGDANSDGNIDAIDASRILAMYAKFSTTGGGSPTTHDYEVCDVNRNGNIDAVDASKVLAYYAFMGGGGTGTFEEYLKKK